MMQTSERRFPIQGETVSVNGRCVGRREAGWVPWGIAEEAYKVYTAKYGKSQSLERLAERGGFGWSELIWLLRGAPKDPECPSISLGREA